MTRERLIQLLTWADATNEDRVLMANSAWDLVDPKLIIRAALEVAEGIGNPEVGK